MPLDNNIEITNCDIAYAEKILLRENEHFDDERRNFIKNLDTIDLQAVPWSWKTTALLAKLIILESKMPFSNWSGILVLSHTNTAVDEIKDRLWKIAPKLFQFPNFIWTIQSFVDEFLTNPYWISFLWINFNHIDSEYYNSKVKYFYNWLVTNYSIKSYIDRNNDPLKFLENIILDKDKNLIKWLYWDNWLRNNSTSQTYSIVSEFKNDLKKAWIISYNEAYYYWFLYLEQFPKIIKILQNRFQFVFVDEMQDMEKHQVDILEKIFYKQDDDKYCFQRIGDKNQAIYNLWDVKIDSEWKWWHRKELQIIWTHRLTKSVANVAKNFWVEFISFDWQKSLKDKNWNNLDDIKPILLVYKTEHLNDENPECSENQVLKEFTKIIHEKIWEWYFSDVKEGKFICKAVIWNAKPQEWWFNREQCRAKHYFFDYDLEWWKSKNKPWLKTEKDYLFYYDKTDTSYKSKNHNIWRLLLRILRLNDIKNPETWKLFSRKETLLEFLKKNHEEKNLELKSKIYDWTKRLNDTNIDEITKEMDEYYFVNFIPSLFSGQITWKTLIWKIFPSRTTPFLQIPTNQQELNTFENNWIKVDIWTVHWVKWETHTCTLYLESSSYSKNESDLCFFLWKIEDEIISLQQETENLNNAINTWWAWIKTKIKKVKSLQSQIKNIKSSWKMLYVWLSRPTHLLCYAIHEDRYNQLISWGWNKEKLEKLWHIKSL